MKIKSLKVAAIALAIVGLSAPSALAITTIQGGPYTNLDPIAGKVHLNLTNFPKDKGLYIFEVVRNTSAVNARPAIINMDMNFAKDVLPGDNHADVVVTVESKFATSTGAVDCSQVTCALWAQFDGASGSYTDTSEDQYISNLTFAASSTSSSPATQSDTISLSINGQAVTTTSNNNLAYRTPETLNVISSSGALLSIESKSPECSIKGNVVEVLKVVAAGCDLKISSPGNATYAASSAHFPFILSPGQQTVTQKVTKLKIGKIENLVAKSNFGEGVAYKSLTKSICTVKGTTVVGLKAGDCSLTVNAVGTTNYLAVASNLTLPVSK